MTVTSEDAALAAQVVKDMWTALGSGDDLGALRATSAAIHEHFGTEPGFAERLLEAFGATRDETARIGPLSKARIVEGELLIACVIAEVDEVPIVGYFGPERRRAWFLGMIREGFGWVVDRTVAQPDEGWPRGTEYVDIYPVDLGEQVH